jgi:hypothetical protein
VPRRGIKISEPTYSVHRLNVLTRRPNGGSSQILILANSEHRLRASLQNRTAQNRPEQLFLTVTALNSIFPYYSMMHNKARERLQMV